MNRWFPSARFTPDELSSETFTALRRTFLRNHPHLVDIIACIQEESNGIDAADDSAKRITRPEQ